MNDLRGVAHAKTPTRVLDLSAKGALMSVTAEMETGAIHDFLLDIGGEGLWVQGEVRRCRKIQGGAYEVAIEFIGLDPQGERRLRLYLDTRLS
jgi:hypothetical protein